jgi:hypothetical protein
LSRLFGDTLMEMGAEGWQITCFASGFHPQQNARLTQNASLTIAHDFNRP